MRCSVVSCGSMPVRDRLSRAAAVVPVALVLVALIVVPLVAGFAQALAPGMRALAALAANGEVRAAIALSVGAALVALVVNGAFGLLAGWTIAKYRFPGKAALVTLIDAPLTVSPIILGLAVLAALGPRTALGAW